MSGSLTPTEQAITQDYENILQRAPDAAGLANWTAAVDSGALTLLQVENAIVASPETQDSVVPIVEMYTALGRAPDAVGLSDWVGALKGGASLTAIAGAFLSSPEGEALYGTGAGPGASDANTAFVTTVYEEVLGRVPDATGLAGWTSALNNGTLTPAEVLTEIVQSPEAQQRDATPVTNFLIAAGQGTADFGGSLNIPGTTFTLTTGQDNIVLSGNNNIVNGTFNGSALTTPATFNTGDSIVGTAGGTGNVLNLADIGQPSILGGGGFFDPTNIAGVTVSGIETLNINSTESVIADTASSIEGFAGLTALNVNDSGETFVTAAGTTNVSVTDSAGPLGESDPGPVAVIGGHNVTVSSAGGAEIGGSEFFGVAATAATAPTGSVTVTDASGEGIIVDGGTTISATETGGGNIAIGGTVAPTGTVQVTDTNAGSSQINVDGGSSVNVTESGTTAGGAIIVGGTAQPTGDVTVNATTAAADGSSIGDIAITGGSAVTVNEAAGDSAKTGTNVAMGSVSVTGTASTTSVTVNQAAVANGQTAATAVAGVVGVDATPASPGVNAVTAVAPVAPVAASAGVVGVSADGAVNIKDAVAPSDVLNTPAGVVGGSIASVTLNNFAAANISSPALNTLTLSGTGGAVNLWEGGADAATNTTLTLNVNDLSATSIRDFTNQFTTMNVVTGAANSTLSGLIDSSLKTLNVSGSSVLTAPAPDSVTAINVTGGAGYTGAVNDTTTVYNASGSTGASTITINADATKAITAGSGTSNEVILDAAGSTFTAANTGANVTGFQVLGLTGATGDVDASVFGSSINTIDLATDGVNSTVTNVNTNAAINVSSAVNNAALNVQYKDTNGSADSTTVTLNGPAASTLAAGSAQTLAELTLEDENGNGIGTLNLVDNNVGFNTADTIQTLVDPNVSMLNFSGVGGLTVGSGFFANSATSMTVNNTGTNAAGLNMGMVDTSLGNLTFTGSGKTNMSLADTVTGTLAVTNAGTGSVTLNGLAPFLAANVTLTGAMTATFADDNLGSLALSNGQNVTLTDNNTTGVTIAGASDNSHVTLNLAGAASGNTDTITLGNANNSVTDASTAGTVNVTVGTGSNSLILGGTTNSTAAFDVTLGSHTAATGIDSISVGNAGTDFATVPNYLISGAVTGDQISFMTDPTAPFPTGPFAALPAQGSLGATITAIEAAAATAPHTVDYSVFGGNTYIAEYNGGGTAVPPATLPAPSAANMSLVELTGAHTLAAAPGAISLLS
jgi:S-layer protein